MSDLYWYRYIGWIPRYKPYWLIIKNGHKSTALCNMRIVIEEIIKLLPLFLYNHIQNFGSNEYPSTNKVYLVEIL